MNNFIKISILIVIIFSTIAPSFAKSATKTKPIFDPEITPFMNGDWYRPTVDTTWQWQLTEDINQDYDVDVYDIDLFDVSADTISELKSSGKKVICYFSAGSAENWRNDFDKFDSSSLGKPLNGWKGEKWLDIRTKNVLDVMLMRLDLAVSKGCDGVEPDNVDGYLNKTGFKLTKNDQLAFNRRIANEAHMRNLTIALKNTVELADKLVDYYDLTLNEECHAYKECYELSIFTEYGKPIFNAEYKFTSKLCSRAISRNIRTLVLPRELDDSSRISCDE